MILNDFFIKFSAKDLVNASDELNEPTTQQGTLLSDELEKLYENALGSQLIHQYRNELSMILRNEFANRFRCLLRIDDNTD